MTDNRTTERVDHPPRVREAIDELMREKDATDNRTTELLREGLTERGVEWKNVGGTTSGDGITEWIVDGMTCRAAQRVTVGIEHLALYIPVLTPDQAIAATLGSGTCEMEYGGDITPDTARVMGVYFCSECGSPIYNDCMPYFCGYCGKAVKR